MIYFEVEAGLCNRLRGTVAAYNFAKDKGQPLTIIWKSDVNCNLKFQSYFLINADIPVNVIDFNCMGRDIFHKMEHQVNKLREKVMKKKCSIVMMRTVKVEELKQVTASENVYLSTCHHWYGENDFSIFQLQPEIAQKVDELKASCGDNCVGVHIRRTDHRDCIQKSPTEAFIREMKKEPEDTVFFIASDDEAERQNLIRVFGEKRIKYQKNVDLSRGTIQGMENAVIDLYMLSKTRKILGSSGSSFSETAGMIGNIPVINCEC